MDLATIIGLVLANGLVFVPIILSGYLKAFIDVGSVLIVIGGSTAAVIIAYPMNEVASIGKILKNVFVPQTQNPAAVVDKLVELAEKARREGILALEKEFSNIQDEFMKKSIQLAVDGNEVETIEEVMNNEIENIEERHKAGKGIFDNFGSMAPAFGMIGTLVGLVQMLQALDDPSNIGQGMAIALITTFYGSLVANVFFIPFANKLERRSKEEILLKNMILMGITSIQNGDNPRVLRDKLETFLAPKDRKGSKE